MPSVTLPPELWIIIIDLVIGALINPADSCTYENFLDVVHYLRYPRPRSSVIPSYRKLRLVCRAFNDLLKTPPRLFVDRVNTKIPAGTRALYTSRLFDSLGCLHRLLEDPSRSRQIVTLDIPCDVVEDIHGLSLFAILVNNSDRLSGVRNLAFDVVHASKYLLDAHFWNTINRAFPALVCLVLRPSFTLGVVMPAEAEENRTVTFEKLEILVVGHALLYDGLNFPLLRHVALGLCNRKVIETLARSPLLESVLLRTILHEENQETINLSSFQKLKLLGIPVYADTVVPLPPDYAHHLCIHVPSSVTGLALVEWVKKVPSHFPKLQQIALDLTGLAWAQRISIESAFRSINLELEPSGLVINHLLSGSSCIVIQRIVEQPKISFVSGVSSTPQNERLWDRWDNFLQTASRKLHL
jgi:hypothetical protein